VPSLYSLRADSTENTAFFNVLNNETQNTATFSEGRIIINNAISREKIYFRIKLHKLCDVSDYTYYMDIDLGMERICV
jgi:hypothetical protein